ncbi:MAG: glycosyltransferase family 4 protein [Planctomycetota bacterium]|nr:glycosyltransferase family 4 protein [Planctomycetaceae bacterium]MDQ3332021.1 glycosyltransferase family 4 protein [Planctomycetota bacterium]
MRIGLVLDRFDRRLGGVEQWTAQLADGLLSRGHEVHVVARSIAERELRPGLTPHELPAISSRLKLADAAADLLCGLDLDVIHDMGFGWYCDVLQPHGGSRIAANSQNLNLSPRWARPIRRMAAKMLPRYREFDALCERQYSSPPADRPWRVVLAISKMVRNDLERHHRLRDSEIRLVYNGVDTERFSPESRALHRDVVRRQLTVSPEQTLHLIVAHNLELKGVPALLRAMALLQAAGQNAVLAVVGGKRIARYERLSQRLGVEGRVRFVGAVDDPTPYYAAADVYTQPTWYDPCSLVLLEALACGLPVVTSRFNGAGELVTPGVCGDVLDDPSDVVTLAAAMMRWSSAATRSAAGIAARESMLANTLDRNVDAIVSVYDEIMRARGRLTSRAA